MVGCFAKDFGPLALKAVRQMMIEGWNDAEHGPQCPLARGVINQRIGRIRRMFRWAAENEMVAPSVYHGLLAVRGLSRGRSPARETDPIQPVSEALVLATLPFLRPQVASMARLQLLTGMRPGEVVIMRGIDLDTSAKIWQYRPGSDKGPQGIHKTAWRGHQRVIAIGPRGQEVLRPWLRLKLEEYLFQPLEAEMARDAERRQSRKTKITPSQARRRPRMRPRKSPSDHYTAASYGHAIRQACFRAGTRVFVTCSAEGVVLKVEGFSEMVVRRRRVGVHEGRLTKIGGLELVLIDMATGCEKCFRAARNTEILLDGQTARLEEFQTTLPAWHPHQLRHTKATEIRREVGLDAARAVLGHRSPAVAEVYTKPRRRRSWNGWGRNVILMWAVARAQHPNPQCF